MPAGTLSQKFPLKPLLLDALGLEDGKGVQSNAERRDTLYYRCPCTSIYCLKRWQQWPERSQIQGLQVRSGHHFLLI